MLEITDLLKINFQILGDFGARRKIFSGIHARSDENLGESGETRRIRLESIKSSTSAEKMGGVFFSRLAADSVRSGTRHRDVTRLPDSEPGAGTFVGRAVGQRARRPGEIREKRWRPEPGELSRRRAASGQQSVHSSVVRSLK